MDSRGYSLGVEAVRASAHAHAVHGIRELPAAVTAHPIRPAINREHAAQMAMMAAKDKVQNCHYFFHNHSFNAGGA
jgi:hypothetical protein